MKKLPLLVFLLVVFVNLAFSQVVNIPDEVLKSALLGIPEVNTNNDDEIQITEAANFAGELLLENLYLEDLTGIEAFVNITGLSVRNNRIVTIDVSNNNHLTYLYCFNNYTIETLILGDQPDLGSLLCYGNKLEEMDVAPYQALTTLRCGNNPIKILDISNNPNITLLDCRNTNLEFLDMRNGNNTAITFFYAPDNNNLSCISVDDATYSTENWTSIDPGVEFSGNCMPYEIEFVVTAGGNPVVGATVNLIKILEETTLTGANGVALFENVGDGSFIYKVEADGYKGEVSSVTVAGANVSVLVELVAGTPDIVEIPDENFKNILLANEEINSNGDDAIQLNEARYYDGDIIVNNQNISDMTGIGAFVNIVSLECKQNDLETLDLRSNIALESLNCTYSFIDSLIFGNNSNLNTILCYGNNLKGLDLSALSALVTIRASNNNISGLDLSANPKLETVSASDNRLLNLDMRNGNNEAIINFYATENQDLRCISVDDVGFATANWMNIDEGLVFSTDCSNSYALTFHFTGSGEPAEGVHLKFNGVYFNSDPSGEILIEGVGPGNYDYSYVYSGYQSNSGSVEVDDNKLESIILTEGEPSIVYIPDYNFRTYLLENPDVNTNTDAEIQVDEASAVSGDLDVSSLGIVDMTGIEAFLNITSLDCGNNEIVTLDVSSNQALTSLSCINNYTIETLTLDNLTGLESLFCYGNSLTELDLTGFPDLRYLRCGHNDFSELDFSLNTKLETLDFRTCANLVSVDIRNGNNANITEFHAYENPNLTCVNVSDPDFAIANWTDIDDGLTFSVDCSSAGNINLAGVQIDGEEFELFDPLITEYIIDLEAGTFEIPVISAQAENQEAEVIITQAESVGGTATIEIVSEDGSNTQIYQITFNVLVSVNDLENSMYKVYPVPASETITVEWTAVPEKIAIFNTEGKVVRKVLNVSNILNISDLQPGNYFLGIANNEKTTYLKFTKSK